MFKFQIKVLYQFTFDVNAQFLDNTVQFPFILSYLDIQ